VRFKLVGVVQGGTGGGFFAGDGFVSRVEESSKVLSVDEGLGAWGVAGGGASLRVGRRLSLWSLGKVPNPEGAWVVWWR